METNNNPLLHLALRASAEGWAEDRTRRELGATVSQGFSMEMVESYIGPISDPTVNPMVVAWIDKMVLWLVDDDESERGQRLLGLTHLALAMAWMMRAKVGGDPAAWQVLRQHYEAARARLPAEGSTGMALMILEMMVDPDAPSPTIDQLPDPLREAMEVLDAAMNAANPDDVLREHLDLFNDSLLFGLRGSIQMAALQGGPAGEVATAALAVLERIEALRQVPEVAPATLAPRCDPLGEIPSWMRAAMTTSITQRAASEDAEPRQWVGDLAGRLVTAHEVDAFHRVVDEWPEAYLPHVPQALRQLIAMMEELDDPGFARAIAAQHLAQERLQQLHAAQPVGALLWDFLDAEGRAARHALADGQPTLQTWAAVQMLAAWSVAMRNRSEMEDAEELDGHACILARRYHHAPLTPAPAWITPWLAYLTGRDKRQLAETLRLIEADSPELAPLFTAYQAEDIDTVSTLARLLELRLWLARQTTAALAVGLLAADMIGMAGEAYELQPVQHQQLMLQMGSQTCNEAADLCRYLDYPAGVAFYRGAAGNQFLLAGNLTAAEEAIREAVAILEQLARTDPAQHDGRRGRTMANLGHVLNEQGQHQAAAAIYRQAEQIYRWHYATQPIAQESAADLGQLLLNMGAVLPQVGQQPEAIRLVQEGVALLHPLEAAEPERYRERCALGYLNLSVLLTNAHRLGEAEDALHEAQTRYHQLAAAQATHYHQAAQEEPDRYGHLEEAADHRYQPQLAAIAQNQTGLLIGQRRLKEAGTAADEAVRRYRLLAEHLPQQYLPHLAAALENQAIVYDELQARNEGSGAVE